MFSGLTLGWLLGDKLQFIVLTRDFSVPLAKLLAFTHPDAVDLSVTDWVGAVMLAFFS